MTCKFGTGVALRLACRGRKRAKDAKHLHAHCTSTLHSSPLNRTAPNTTCQGLTAYRVWCLLLKLSLHRRSPRQRSYSTLARGACTPQERQPQKHTGWGSARVTCKFGLCSVPRLTCRSTDKSVQARATCHMRRTPLKSAKARVRRVGLFPGVSP